MQTVVAAFVVPALLVLGKVFSASERVFVLQSGANDSFCVYIKYYEIK